jgi:uncharacterized protein with HEPN domain
LTTGEAKSDALYVLHILECIKKIEEYVEGDPEMILRNPLVLDAVLRNLQILAESTQRLSDQVKARYTQIDWRGIAGFRNQLVHSYLGIDEQAVVAVIRNDLDPLREAMEDAKGNI